MVDLSSVTDWLFGRGANSNPQTETHLAEPRSQYPTDEDVDFARKNDWSYGQPWAPEFNNKSATIAMGHPKEDTFPKETWGTGKYDLPWPNRLEPTMKDYYAKAALASEGSALAKLGFDPTKFAVDPALDIKNSSYGGLYNPKNDTGWSVASSPGAIVHESIHRGIHKLSESPFWKPEFDQFKSLNKDDSSNPNNEYMVRHLMETKMGNPERDIDSWAEGSRMQRDIARNLFNADKRRKILDDMENAAASYIAAKRPGGPR